MNITNKGLLIGAGVVALGIGVGVYLGKRKAKKNKEKETENELAEMKKFEEQMRKQAEEERVRAEEDEKWIKTTDEMLKKAETVQNEHPITREDLVEAITKDPEFANLLMKYISPVKAMAMKHMPSRNDIKEEESKKEPVTANNGSDNLTEPYSHGVIPMHIVNHKEGIEYDAYPPVNSINDIANIKPLNTEPVKKTLADQANEIREEFDNAIKSLSEDDQLAIANRILDGAFIVMCGKQVQLSDLTIMKADMNQISEKVLAFILGNTYRISPNILHSSVRDVINNIIGTPNNSQVAKEDNSNINAYEYELQRLTVEQQFTIMSKLLSGETVTIAGRKVELTDLPAVRNNASLLSPEFQAYVANMVNKQVSAPQPSAPITPSVQTFTVPFSAPNVNTRIDRFGSKTPASDWKTSAEAANMWIKNYKN
jgi:hypothetical protein|nr:MAG TPA: Cytadhesin P30/P32 [Caudoviricetes sp.]